jgi:hypothetical protein
MSDTVHPAPCDRAVAGPSSSAPIRGAMRSGSSARLAVMWFMRNDRWLLTAGAAVGESEETHAGTAVCQA